MEEHLKSASPPPSNGVNNSNLNTNDFLLTTQENTNQLNNITNNDIVLQDSNEPSNDERKQRLEEEKKIFQEESLKWENRISADVWDTEAWTSLVLEAQTKDIEIAREIYERFLKQFPTVVNSSSFFFFLKILLFLNFNLGKILEILCGA